MKKCLTPLVLALLLFSCSKDPNPVISNTPGYLSGTGLFVINEGNFRAGNGSLSFYSDDSTKIYNNIFSSINSRPLGDVPYSMNVTGNKAYIIVNNSGKIEVTDKNNLESITTINGLSSPRYLLTIGNSKAYVTSLYSDSVTVIDLNKNKVTGYINIKKTSESIVSSSSKAFIANWVGGNKVYVVSTVTDQVIDSVEVGKEPESMVVDKNGTVWVLCNGGWMRDVYAELIGIDPITNDISKRFVFPSKSDSPVCLQIDGKGENLFYLQNGVRKMSINASGLPQTPLVPETDRYFYKLGVNPSNDEIFVTDAGDYQQKGYLLRYTANGEFSSVLQADIIPGSMFFKAGTESVK